MTNLSISAESRPFVEELARFAMRTDVADAIAAADREARTKLARNPAAVSIFEDIDLSRLRRAGDHPVGSARVVVTRADVGGSPRVERHANSAQYLLAIDGAIETHVETATGWRVDRYGGGSATVLENRWHVVPINVWHRSQSVESRDWAVAAFHAARHVSEQVRKA